MRREAIFKHFLVLICLFFVAACGTQYVRTDMGEKVELPEELVSANKALDQAAVFYRTGMEEAAKAYINDEITTQEWSHISKTGMTFHEAYHTANDITKKWMEAIIKGEPFTKKDALREALTQVQIKEDAFVIITQTIVGEVFYGDGQN